MTRPAQSLDLEIEALRVADPIMMFTNGVRDDATSRHFAEPRETPEDATSIRQP
jgi:hypothetical protein